MGNENSGSAQVKGSEHFGRFVDAHKCGETRGAGGQDRSVKCGTIKWSVFRVQAYAIKRRMTQNFHDGCVRSPYKRAD